VLVKLKRPLVALSALAAVTIPLAACQATPAEIQAANRINRYLLALRTCETGNNYRMTVWSGGRLYGGAYGFDVIYWRAQGHSPDPQYASAGMQDQVIIQDIRMMGASRSNPGCTARLGPPSAW
jgi:hypothetical protein